ncbi:hypothetical protein KR059_009037, partial [Drosophila kikkawai]
SRRSRVTSKKSPRSKLSRKMTSNLKQLSLWKKFRWRENSPKKSRNFQRRFASSKQFPKMASQRRRRFALALSRRSRVTSKKSPRSKQSRKMTSNPKQQSLWKKFRWRKNSPKKS